MSKLSIRYDWWKAAIVDKMLEEKKMEKVIVKIGSNVLVPNGQLNIGLIDMIANEISSLMRGGNRFAIVTSGAVRAGRTSHNIPSLPANKIADDQFLAFKGQPRLMAHYVAAFGVHNVECGQLLLTQRNFADQDNMLTVQRVINMALASSVIPVINENDPITAEELKNPFTDNDALSALVAPLINADKLIVLSDIPGFLLDTSDPASVVPVIYNVDEYLHLIDPSAGNGRGGMRSKLETAREVTDAGTEMYIADGTKPGVISDILDGKQVGTRFPAKA